MRCMNGGSWIIWSIVLLIVILLTTWALRGNRAKGRRRCAKCLHSMHMTPGRTCPECGWTGANEAALFRTRRRWKTAAFGVVMLCIFAAAPFWKSITLRYAEYLPTTALIMLHGRIHYDDPDDQSHLHDVLLTRLFGHDVQILVVMSPYALPDHLWELLEREKARALPGSEARRPSDRPTFPLTHIQHDDLLRLTQPSAINQLPKLVELLRTAGLRIHPTSTFEVSWVDVRGSDGRPARCYLISTGGYSTVLAVYPDGEDWRLVGLIEIWSWYARPDISIDPNDPTLVRISGLTGGGTRMTTAYMAWLEVGPRGPRIVYSTMTYGVWASVVSMYQIEQVTPTIQLISDARGRFIEQTTEVTLTASSSFIVPEDLISSSTDRDALGQFEVLQRTAVGRFRWNPRSRTFNYDPDESDLLERQFRNFAYMPLSRNGVEMLLMQNRDAFTAMARQRDPIATAWLEQFAATLRAGPARDWLEALLAEYREEP